MAKKRTYRVEFKGQVFTRTTEREYAYLVVGRRNVERVIAGAKASRALHLKNHAFHVQEANPATRKFESSVANQAEYAAFAAMTADEYADGLVAHRLAETQKEIAGGVYDVYCDLGWSSRLDLAQKNAASYAGNYVDIRVLEVKS